MPIFAKKVPFVLQIFAAVGLTGYLSISNGQRAVHKIGTQLSLRIEVVQHLDFTKKLVRLVDRKTNYRQDRRA